MLRIFKKLIIVSNLTNDIFNYATYGCLKYVRVTSEEKLKELLNSYDIVVSYVRPDVLNYLKSLRKDIIEDAKIKYSGEDILLVEPRYFDVSKFEDIEVVFLYEIPCLE